MLSVYGAKIVPQWVKISLQRTRQQGLSLSNHEKIKISLWGKPKLFQLILHQTVKHACRQSGKSALSTVLSIPALVAACYHMSSYNLYWNCDNAPQQHTVNNVEYKLFAIRGAPVIPI